MTENIFFDHKRLAHCGSNVIIGKTVRIRYPELVFIGDNVIIDDFTYISTSLCLSQYVHIAAGSKLIGGRKAMISIGSFSSLAPNVVIAAGSDDYIGGIASPLVPVQYKGNMQIGKIEIGNHCVVGANTTLLPNVKLDNGAAVGAQSLVKSDLDAWKLYAGIPAKFIKDRDKNKILAFENSFLSES